MAHVSLITLAVDDLARATEFYLALGWERSDASMDGSVAFLRGGSVILGLFGRDDLAADATVPADASFATNLASRQAVDERIEEARRAGARIVKAPIAAEWGGYHGYFEDLDGHLWEVAHNPFWELRDDGKPLLPEDDA